jgi:hypothetical protein
LLDGVHRNKWLVVKLRTGYILLIVISVVLCLQNIEKIKIKPCNI